MGSDDVRKQIDERLEYITKELFDISTCVPEGPLQERLSNLCGQVKKLVYESLELLPGTTSEEHLTEPSGLIEKEKDVDHRSNQTSFGGVPELFVASPDEPLHQHSVSFGGIRQLFDVEMDVFEAEDPLQGVNGHVDESRKSPSLSPTYEGVDLLFKDGPLQATENFNGVSEMFRKLEDQSVNLGNEFNPNNIQHGRSISYGGVRQLDPDQNREVADLEKMIQQKDAESNKNESSDGFKEDAHNRRISHGGVRQLISVECDILSEDEIQESAKVSNIVQDKIQGHDRSLSIGGVRQLQQDGFEEELTDLDNRAAKMSNGLQGEIEDDQSDAAEAEEASLKASKIVQDMTQGHDRSVSIGGVRQLQQDGFEDELFDLDDRAAKMSNELPGEIEDDQSDAAETEEAVVKGGITNVEKHTNQDEESGHDHGRTISHGGVRPLQDFEMDVLDELSGDLERKPRELFDGQVTLEDPRGHERRRSNLQDGRELFESPGKLKTESGATFDPLKDSGDSDHRLQMQNLKRELLQLKMSKIELIKSTAEEIDRLRAIIKTLAIQLRHITEEYKKVLNATLGGQMLGSVSGVFGSFTSFFSPAPEPSPLGRGRI